MKKCVFILLIFPLVLLAQVSEVKGKYPGCKYLREPMYLVNNKSVYFENCILHRKVNVNPESIVNIGKGLLHDGENIYYNGIKLDEKPGELKLVDYNSNSLIWINNNNLYRNSTKINEVDAVSFNSLKGGYAKDKDKVYYYGETIKDANSNSFISSYEFSFDTNYVYSKGERIIKEGFLKAINGHFFKDDKNVYQYNSRSKDKLEILLDFKIEDCKSIAKTNYGIINDKLYYKQEICDSINVNLAEVKVFNEDLIAVNNQLLYKGYIVDELDAKSLKLLDSFYYEVTVSDKKGIYSVIRSNRKIEVKKLKDISEAYKEVNYYSSQNIVRFSFNNAIEQTVLDQKGIVSTKDFELVSLVQGYRMGCSQDTRSSSNFYILKNKKGYWRLKISRYNTIDFIGESYKF